MHNIAAKAAANARAPATEMTVAILNRNATGLLLRHGWALARRPGRLNAGLFDSTPGVFDAGRRSKCPQVEYA